MTSSLTTMLGVASGVIASFGIWEVVTFPTHLLHLVPSCTIRYLKDLGSFRALFMWRNRQINDEDVGCFKYFLSLGTVGGLAGFMAEWDYVGTKREHRS